MNVTAIRAVVPAGHESVLAFDPSDLAKSGTRTEGLGYFWNGCAGRAERGLETHVLSWVDVTANTAYAISAALTPPKVAAEVPTTTEAPTTAEAVDRRSLPKTKIQAKAKPKTKPKAKAKTQRCPTNPRASMPI